MSLKDVLKEFEDKSSFEFYDLASAISNLPQKEQDTFEAKSELLAMSFSEGGYDEWKRILVLQLHGQKRILEKSSMCLTGMK